MSTLREIDVTLVSARRPDLVARTMKSFHANLFTRLPVRRLFVNIDPIWGTEADDREVERICREVLPDTEQVYRRPAQAHFCRAVKWLWSQPSGEWFLHMEDDWDLVRPIDLDQLQKEMRYPGIKQIALRRPPKLWRKSQTSPYFGTSPSFIDVPVGKMAASLMRPEMDPEKQFYKERNPELIAAVRPYRIRFHGGRFARPPIVDTGREWREARGIEKVVEGGLTSWTAYSPPDN